MSLTLEDVARLSGVSRSTVSRVINHDPNVNARTRQRVEQVIHELNFQPNLAARGLAAGQTRVLGLVIPKGVSAIFADPYFPLLIQGVSSACNASEYSVMLWLAEPEYERRMIRQILHNGLVNGVIVSSMLLDDPIVEALIEGRLPFVLIGRHLTNERLNYIDVDNRNAAHEAVAHLLRLGRRRVATITGPQNTIVGMHRYEGYLEALRERNIPLNGALVVEGDFSDMSGYVAMQRLLVEEVDAVFCASDGMAMGALRALHEYGKRVPQDIALVGFDDSLAAHTNPPLTTVRQPTQRMGMLATETLIDIIQHPDSQPRRLILPTELVVRSSCGAIPG